MRILFVLFLFLAFQNGVSSKNPIIPNRGSNDPHIRHNAIMTTLNKACHFDDEGGEISLCEVADFSQKVEMTGANKVSHWHGLK